MSIMRQQMIFLFTLLLVTFTIGLNADALSKPKIIEIIKDGNVLTVKNFLNKNKNFNVNTALDKWGYTMLMQLICNVHPDIVKVLLEIWADPTIRSKRWI